LYNIEVLFLVIFRRYGKVFLATFMVFCANLSSNLDKFDGFHFKSLHFGHHLDCYRSSNLFLSLLKKHFLKNDLSLKCINLIFPSWGIHWVSLMGIEFSFINIFCLFSHCPKFITDTRPRDDR